MVAVIVWLTPLGTPRRVVARFFTTKRYWSVVLFVGAFSAPTNTPAMRHLYQIMAVIAAINAAVGAYYYLRVVGVMYFRTPLRPATRSRAVPTFLAAVALAGATLFFGIYPEPIVKAARKAAPVPAAPQKAIAEVN